MISTDCKRLKFGESCPKSRPIKTQERAVYSQLFWCRLTHPIGWLALWLGSLHNLQQTCELSVKHVAYLHHKSLLCTDLFWVLIGIVPNFLNTVFIICMHYCLITRDSTNISAIQQSFLTILYRSELYNLTYYLFTWN